MNEHSDNVRGFSPTPNLNSPSRIEEAVQSVEESSSEEEADRMFEVTGMCETLVDMNRMIETSLKKTIEEYLELSRFFRNDKKFMKIKQDRYRQLDSVRSNARTEAAKQREQEIVENRKRRNMEKLAQKERVQSVPTKRIMYRSP
jgi:hypothetical protein